MPREAESVSTKELDPPAWYSMLYWADTLLTFDPFWTARNFCQDQMDDILSQIMLATGDPYLGASDGIATISLRLRLGADQTKIGTTLRLGQIHGPGPFP